MPGSGPDALARVGAPVRELYAGQEESRARLQSALEQLREHLLRLQRKGVQVDGGGLYPVLLRLREATSGLHEAHWLARQTTQRLTRVARMLDEVPPPVGAAARTAARE